MSGLNVFYQIKTNMKPGQKNLRRLKIFIPTITDR